MAGCRIVNSAMTESVNKINQISANYKTLGENFIQDLNSAIAEMEGETKDALKHFIDTDVKDFVETGLPEAVSGMGQLLEANRSNFEDIDRQIAASISGS